jgi:hypothetical protein
MSFRFLTFVLLITISTLRHPQDTGRYTPLRSDFSALQPTLLNIRLYLIKKGQILSFLKLNDIYLMYYIR